MGGKTRGGTRALQASLRMAARWARKAPIGCLLAAALTTPVTTAAFAACPSKDRFVLLIVDASVSMLRLGLGGLNRFDAAREAIASDLEVLPGETRVALRLFGSRSPARRTDCQDSNLAVPFAPAASNSPLIIRALAANGPQGITPMAYSLRSAATDFPKDATNRTIILVSDGGETCGDDACAAAGELAQDGIVINAVAIQPDRNGQRQLQCIAQTTGGNYFPVPTTTVLADRIEQAIDACPVAEERPRWTTAAAG